MSTAPEHDPELVEMLRIMIGGTPADRLFVAKARAILDLIREHESETGRAWWWVPAPDVIPAGHPYRIEYPDGFASEHYRPSDIRNTPGQRVTGGTYFVDSRWTPSEPERVSVDKAALDALARRHAHRDLGTPIRTLLDSVQPLDGGA